MTNLEVSEYTTFEEFAHEWDISESETRMLWQLLGQLDSDEVLIEIPEWLAEEKIGYVDGAIPTLFVGRIERETEKAILFEDSAATTDLKKTAHQIDHLEQGEEDPNRNEWLDKRLRELRTEFENRDGVTTLAEEWLPKSQIDRGVRRRDDDQ